MKFAQALIPGSLIKRYKRFLADIELDDGRVITAHTPNTGSMLGCCEPGSRVWLSDSGNPERKYPLSWELVEEGIRNGVIKELQGYDGLRREVRYGAENSRIDLLLEDAGKPACYVEVKNVTLAQDGTGYFPDAVSARGSKHLRELAAVVAAGQRGIILFCVQRKDVSEVRPADTIDRKYGNTLRQVIDAGVEAIAWRADVTPEEIRLDKSLPVRITD